MAQMGCLDLPGCQEMGLVSLKNTGLSLGSHHRSQGSDMRLAWNRVWALSLIAGLGFLLIGFLVWVSLRVTLPSAVQKGQETKQVETQPQQTALTNPQPQAVAPPGTPTALIASQLEQVIAGIREANQKKDLPQLLGHYSSNFPQLTQRAQTISKAWKIYDYPRMDFEVREARLLSANKASAQVTWHVEAKKINASTRKNVSNTYLINFVKESGQWRIISAEPIK